MQELTSILLIALSFRLIVCYKISNAVRIILSVKIHIFAKLWTHTEVTVSMDENTI